jgi:hypothetical protein
MSRWLSTSKYTCDVALLQPCGSLFAQRPVDGVEWHWWLLMVVGGGWGWKEEVVVGGVDGGDGGGCVQISGDINHWWCGNGCVDCQHTM